MSLSYKNIKSVVQSFLPVIFVIALLLLDWYFGWPI